MATYRIPVLEDFVWQPPVIDKDLTTPPAIKTKGDRYIVGTGAGGDWSGHDDDITYYDGADWQFDTPNEGCQLWVKDEDAFYVYKGESHGWVLQEISEIGAISQAASQALSTAEANSGNIQTNSDTISAHKVELDAVSGAVSAVTSAAKANSAGISANVVDIQTNSNAASAAASAAKANSAGISANVADKQDKGTYVSEYGAIEFTI